MAGAGLVTRAWRTLFVERKLPYRLQGPWDRLCTSLGVPEKVVAQEGFRFRVRRATCDEDFVRNVVANREYFPPEIHCSPTHVIVDVGGNIGTFGVLVASMADRGRVVIAEPAADNLRLLQLNLALNHVKNASVWPVAVTGSNGPVLLYSADQGGFHSVLQSRLPRGRATRVDGVTLATLFDAAAVERCDLLKLDCEGAEFDIVDSLTPELARRIDQIAMEYHAPGQRLIARLEGLGFAILKHEKFDPPYPGGHLFVSRLSKHAA
jgi:FkbM family methyltransferase